MPIRVLLADDHLIVRQGLRALLEQAGMEVVAEASDGLEAVRLAEKHKPDVAVLDLVMPNLNGLEAGEHDQHEHEQRAGCDREQPDADFLLLAGRHACLA